jgi:uncharacterized protein DUF4826
LSNQEALEAEKAKFEQWAREQLQACGEYVQQQGLITSEAKARAGWAMPGRVFVGLVTSGLNPDLSYWVITGPDTMPDHVEAGIAKTARDAVRHFALRWQLHGAQAETIEGETTTDEAADWSAKGAELAKRAEALYAFTQDDGLWPPEGD